MQVFTTDTHLVIVMEHMGGQILEKMLKDEGCVEESRARELFRQLVEAVDYAHKQVSQFWQGLPTLLWVPSASLAASAMGQLICSYAAAGHVWLFAVEPRSHTAKKHLSHT